MPTLAGNKHPSVHFFPHGPRLFYLSTEKRNVRSVINRGPSGFSPADTKNNDINKRWQTFPLRDNTKKQWKNNLKYGKIKIIDEKKVHVHMLHQLKHCWEQTKLFSSPFHVSISWRLNLAGAFRSDYVAACSTAFRSATEENDSGGYVDVPCPSKVKEHSSTADWLKF